MVDGYQRIYINTRNRFDLRTYFFVVNFVQFSKLFPVFKMYPMKTGNIRPNDKHWLNTEMRLTIF